MKFIFKTIGIILLIIFLSVIVITILLFRDYRKWETAFENSHLTIDFVQVNEDTVSSFDEKIKKFSESTDKTTFVELNKSEFIYLLNESIKTSISKDLVISNSYIESEKGKWDLHIKMKYMSKYDIPWIKLVILKDNIESPEIFLGTIVLGNYDFRDYGLGFVVTKVNTGIREAIQLANNSEFTGRVIKNIELDKNTVIIKGEK